MKIIGSKKSLFAKTAVIGFIIPIISIVLLLLIRQDNARKMQRAAQTEARSYCNSVLKMSEVLANELAQDAATLMKKHFESSNDLSQAIDTSTKDITAKGIDSTILLFYNHNEKLFSNSNTPGSTTFYRNLEGFGNEQNPEIIAFQDQIYSTATVNIDKPGGSLVMLIPLEALFASIDRDKRLQKPEPLQNGQQLVSSSGSMIIVPIEAYNGSVTASVGVKFEHGLDQNSTIPSSQVLALGLLPLFGFFLFSYLLYRYFDSFAHYLETIRKILRREKNGVELFRRDHHLVKNEMPELSEIYTLIEESLKEKAQLGQVLDTVKAMLSLLQEKGHDESGLNGIVELIVNFTGSTSGAIFASDSGDDRTDLIGLHNCDKELLSGIIQTGAGRSFIKAVRKNETILYLRTEELAAEPWSKLFDGYQQIVAIPLIFKAQFEGFLVLLSTERDLSIRIPEYFDGLIGEFLADIAYSVGIEKENLARQDKTKILQETSLAISSKLDLPSVLQVVASHLTEYAGATYCMIILNTDFENTLEVASLYSKRQNGISIPEASRINAIDLPKVKEAIEGKRTLIFGPQELADFGAVEKRFFRAESVKQLTILPISHSAKTIGAVVLGEERSQSRATLAPERLSFVQAIVSQAASAIENARLYGFINNKVDQLTTLYEVGAVIHSETNIKSMLEKVLGAIHDYLHYTVSGIYTIDDKNNTLRPLVVNAVNFETGTDKIALRAPDCVSELVVANGKPLNIADFRVEENIKPSFPSLLSELAVPIKLGTKNIGVFTVGSRAKCAFTEMHENFMRALSAQLAVSMERARLFEQEHERGLKLNTIFEISKKLSKSLNVQEVIKIASDSIQEAFHHQLVAVFLLDRVNRRYYTGYQASSSDKKLPDDFAIAEGCGLVGTAIKSRKTIYIPDVYSEPEYVLGIEDVKSEICIPIILGDKILGVLDAESMELNGFTTEDISTLEAVADIMAVAIDNSYLFEETIQKAERLSLIDNINKAISATLDLDSFFRVVAKAVADNAGYRWTSLVVPDGESFIFKAGYAPKSVGIISTESMLEMLKSRLKSVIEQCAPEFLSFAQLVALGAPEKLQSVVDAGIRNLALFPIGDATRAEAVMIVGSANSDGFTVQELQLLKDLAVHLRIAWQNAQLFKELKTAYDQLQDAQDRIVQTEKLRALGEMSSGVVHDFNNVLAAILGRLQIVSKKLDNFESWSGRQFLQKNLDLIEKAANDGSHILSRINEFTKKKPSEKFVDVYLDQLIADTVELTRPRWQDRALMAGKQINVTFQYEGNLRTTGSPTELREVFTNLINNAVDAINGDAKITIDAHLELEKDIKITVQDTGAGMSAETRKKIFEPFFTTKGAGGTGLGLSVTYGIITRHKGTIEVDSELGQGTKFTITLPVRVCGQDETKSLPIAYHERKACNILVVDDEEGFREVLVEILDSGGHTTDSAPSADIALQMLGNNSYDLVITDLGMTGLSGWELADAIYLAYPDIRIIMATGWGANINPENLSRHHINSVICKPFKIDEILRVIDEALVHSRDEVLVEQN